MKENERFTTVIDGEAQFKKPWSANRLAEYEDTGLSPVEIADLERDKGVFVSELSKIVTTNQCLEDNLKWLNRRRGEYTNAFFNIKEIIERASDLNKSDKEKILSIINRFQGDM